MDQQAQILFPTTEIGGSVSITNTLGSDTANRTAIILFKQATVPGHSDRNHLPIGSFNGGIDVLRSRQNIDKCNGMNPQGPIVTTIPESNGYNNCNIFDLVRRTLDLSYSILAWNGTMTSEGENLAENLR